MVSSLWTHISVRNPVMIETEVCTVLCCILFLLLPMTLNDHFKDTCAVQYLELIVSLSLYASDASQNCNCCSLYTQNAEKTHSQETRKHFFSVLLFPPITVCDVLSRAWNSWIWSKPRRNWSTEKSAASVMLIRLLIISFVCFIVHTEYYVCR